MTTPSKAAMEAAKKFTTRHICSDAPYMTGQLATAFDAFAAERSAALLEALERTVKMADAYAQGVGTQYTKAMDDARAAIAAAKERK